MPSLIYKHPSSGGELHQSGAMEIPGIARTLNTHGYIHCEEVVKGLEAHDFSILVLTAGGFQPAIELGKSDDSDLRVIHLPFADDENMSDHDVAKVEKMIRTTSFDLARAIENGQKVLSTCWAGINRSSLLTAFTLRDLTTMATQDIIDLIRSQRSDRCLNNTLFERIVLYDF